MMTPTELSDALREMELFSEFTDTEILNLLDLVTPVSVPENEALVRQDDHGDTMYVIVRGTVRVIHHAGGKEFQLAILKSGDFFGEIALVDEGPRSADVVAAEPVVVLEFKQSVIRALAGVYPGAAFKLLVAVGRTLIDRMRQGNKKYIDSLLVSPQTQAEA